MTREITHERAHATVAGNGGPPGVTVIEDAAFLSHSSGCALKDVGIKWLASSSNQLE